MRKNAQELTANFCEGYSMKEEMLINYTEKDKQVMILDLGAPVSLAGKEWMDQYLRRHEVRIEDMRKQECNQIFRFGPSKRYVSTEMIELPLIVKKIQKYRKLWGPDSKSRKAIILWKLMAILKRNLRKI